MGIDKNSEEFKLYNKAINDCINEVSDNLLEYNCTISGPFGFTDRAFLSSVYIMTSALLERMWELQVDEEIHQSDRESMAHSFGNELRLLIKKFTSIDTIEFTKEVLLINKNITDGTIN